MPPIHPFAMYLQAAGDDGSAGGGAADRGDELVNVDDPAVGDPKEDPKEEPKEEPKEDGKKKEVFLPKSRYDAKSREVKELRGQLVEMQKQNAVLQSQLGENTPVSDISAKIEELDAQIEAARADGKTDEVVKLMREQRKIERTHNQQLLSAVATRTRTQAVEEVKVDSLIQQLEAEHDNLNPDSESYDEGLVAEILEIRDDFLKAGRSASDALLRAVRLKMPDISAKDAAAMEKVADKQAKADDKSGPRKTDVKGKLDIANKQPPKSDEGLAGDAAGKTGTGMDVTKLSMEEFEKLPKDTIRRMRGDLL